jgi:hypothetical protein
LIELALAIPVFVAIVYYLHDITRYKHLKKRVEFVTYEIAGMIQNISQRRANKRISLNDLRYCVPGAFLSFYPGTRQFPASYNVFKQPGAWHGKIFYVVGNANGTASVKWALQYQIVGGSGPNTSPGTMTMGVGNGDSDTRYITRVRSNVAPSAICPELSIKPGEIKIIIENFIYFERASSFILVNDSRTWADFSSREAFGFLLLTPKVQGGEFYFDSIVIFTPKPGLFSETPP